MSQNIPELELPFATLVARYPHLKESLTGYGLTQWQVSQPLPALLAQFPASHFEDIAISREQLLAQIAALISPSSSTGLQVEQLTLIGGQNKNGEAENFRLDLHPGDVTCIVGPTGSGKSRLLADIEWMAQGDTPTGRCILINDRPPEPELRFSLEHKLVAQLSQNMNFVMDSSVADFIQMHAESRMVSSAHLVAEIIEQANYLAGESFNGNTPITSLSGGQSRALMIADTAFLSASPVVLIDEIENAGIDRKQALQLLIRQEKIVLMATHDPILALMGSRRLVIKHGGVHAIRITSAAERNNLAELEAMDARIQSLRQRLRQGETLDIISGGG